MLTGKYRQGEKGRAEGFGGRVFQPENSAQRTQILDTMLGIAAELGVSAGQVAIAWAGTHGAAPIIGPRSLTQLIDNLGALSLVLSAEQISRLDTVSSLVPLAPARTTIPWAVDNAVRIVA
jgi:aryl-alcohol dehydrogenase-like predicted oxidoreductase